VYAVKVERGRHTSQVLADEMPGFIASFEFPKPMRWGNGDFPFGRPIRWIVCLLGGDVVEFEVAGVKSGRSTRGHRVLGPGPFDIPSPDEYEALLERAGVVVDQDRRREWIAAQAEAVAAKEGGEAVIDPDLLEQVNYLVEFPTAFVGRFSKDFLELPKEVLVTTMQHHQRYFPVFKDGKPLACFVAVRNGPAEGLELVRHGNEKVVRARFSDAVFFFVEDRKVPPEERVDLLKQIVFQEKLGTLYDKTQRLRFIARFICAATDLAPEAVVDRAASLCKTDLTTNMVREFPELQGVMGREYARLAGERPEVSEAIFEHYLPRHAGDSLPATGAGIVLALADKVDTLVGCFSVGLIPTGSQDPYALRRSATGIVAVAASRKVRVPLDHLVDAALGGLTMAGGLEIESMASVKSSVLDFLKGRVKAYLEDGGIRYDVVDAVLAAGFYDVYATVRRAEALQRFIGDPDFTRMMAGFKRAANLARQAASADVDPGLFSQGEEERLHSAVKETRTRAERSLADEDYEAFFRCVAGLREPVDEFLDRVLVMAEDPSIRANRLALLASVVEISARAADLSRLVVS